MGLDLRLMHVKPGTQTRVWDLKLMDERKDGRVFVTMDGQEYIEVLVLRNTDNLPRSPSVFPRPHALYANDQTIRSIPTITKSRRRKLAKKRSK